MINKIIALLYDLTSSLYFDIDTLYHNYTCYDISY